MAGSGARGCSQDRVIYPRTSKADLEQGIPIITRAEGVRLFDQTGKAYMGVGVWFAPERRVANALFAAIAAAVVAVTVVGTFFRGPNWAWVWPW